jgi:plasmid stabilization system protein ParE
MKARCLFLPAADRDIDSLARYYAREAGIDTAVRFLDAVKRTCEMLATHPRMGWPCRLRHPELASTRVFRVLGFDKILVFYRPAKNRVEVLRVQHGSRHLESLFD